MELVAIIKVVSWIFIVFVAACIYGQQKKDPVNLAYFLFSTYAGTWVFLELIVDIPFFHGSEDTILRVVSLVWIPAGFFFMNFAYALAGRKVDGPYVLFLALAVFGAIVGATTDWFYKGATRYPFGAVDIRDPLIHDLFTFITIFPTVFGFWLIGKRYSTEKEVRIRRNFLLVFVGGFFSFSSCWVLNVFIPNTLGILDFPRLGSSSLAVLVVVVYFAMRRFNFLAITVESVAGSLFHNVEHGLALLSPEGNIQKMNRSFASLIGKSPEELAGGDMKKFFPQYHISRGRGSKEVTVDLGGEARQFALSRSRFRQGGVDVGTVLQARDITENEKARDVLRVSKEQLELELQGRTQTFLQIQKMEAIGILAGGMAHDFNNLLTAILGFATSALDDVDAKDSRYRDIEEIIWAAEKAKRIVAKISSFRPRSDEDRTLVDPSIAVNESLGLIGASIPNNVVLRRQTPHLSGQIFLDETLLHQSLLNLLTNACHAMKQGGGELRVELEEVRVDEKTAAKYASANPGPHARITVADTGVGISKRDINRIFEPFYTTKDAGEGTGLGLATVLRMAKDSGGFVTVKSEKNKGSTFSVYLPLRHTEADVKAKSDQAVQGGNERIFIVDDNEQVALAGRRMLAPLGYDVEIFTGGEDALGAFETNQEDVDLVIADESMPKMTGTELSKQLLRKRPDLPILLISGGETGEKTRIAAAEVGIAKFLAKPVGRDVLATTVRRLLDR